MDSSQGNESRASTNQVGHHRARQQRCGSERWCKQGAAQPMERGSAEELDRKSTYHFSDSNISVASLPRLHLETHSSQQPTTNLM